MDKKISVIMPVYNMERYLPQCLDSIVGQTMKDDIEIIAVNDGSTDESLSVLERYQKDNKNIVIISQENHGKGHAKNNGMSRAVGKYFAFMDPDDFYPDSDCLEALYLAAEEKQALLCGGIIIQNYDHARTVFSGNLIRKYYCNQFVNVHEYPDIYGHQKFLYRADFIRKNHINFPDYRRFNDPPFSVKAMICAEEFYCLDKAVYEYRVGHARQKYSLETSVDILHSIRDVFQLAADADLKEIYQNRLRHISEDNYIVPFYQYAYCGNEEIDNAIEEINRITKRWFGKEAGVGLTEEKVLQMRIESKKEYRDFTEFLKGGEEKIIYGAGWKARDLLHRYGNRIQRLIGIAVTEKKDNSEECIEGIPIKQIDSYLPYREKLAVMIATSGDYQKEIERLLKSLGFLHIFKFNLPEIELAEAMKTE